ncbi:hypothetical protein AGDE_07610 [Angomonas deanei]|uniref:Uncharacterized protein n=1 Tax=Angomonas deanei TaxID=59799 RepID=S9WH11_9TRYP|nr:hypothetical protein AGDE_08898 [Angomonas deanei]EPY35055.1 hypothetical protein AGDE_07610 [Angomonas deanei]CAD2218980.1 hypothetical protein, conserved [Angomonas deanei]|eukprot:EPY32035.1 hypothetical protein AGDE_08898 [Angomonas deanei]
MFFFCYEPNISYLVDFVLQDVGDDYLLYKDSVDSYRRRLPDEFKVPFTYEANRVGTTVFAWSLLSPEEAKYAVETACRVLPTADQIMSIGSGGGYVEHVFNRVLHNVVLDPQWEVNRKTFPKSYFDNVKADIGGRQLPIFAFDELALKNTYSVHVSIGDPLALLSATRNTILLLCWPPFGSPTEEQSSMAFEALEYFTQRGGEVVIYVGDVASTGDWRFHELLRDQYKLVKGYPVRHEVRRWYPQEMGLIYAGNDTVGVYQRRGYL